MAVTTANKTWKDGNGATFTGKRGIIDTDKDIPLVAVVGATSEAAADLALDATIVSMSAKLPATLGTKASAASMSVVLSNDHAALPLPTGAATEATLAAASAKLPATLGAKASAASMSVVPATDGVFSVSGFQSMPKATLAASTSAYAVGDVVGVVTALPVFRVNGGSGVLAHLSIRSRSTTVQTPSLTVFLFETPPAAQTDNAALSLTAAEWDTLVEIVPLTLAAPAGVPVGFTFTEAAASLSIPVKNGNSTTNLYAIVTTGTAFTLVAATDLVIQARLSQD